jgi:hypothetical protein
MFSILLSFLVPAWWIAVCVGLGLVLAHLIRELLKRCRPWVRCLVVLGTGTLAFISPAFILLAFAIVPSSEGLS